MKRNKQQLKQDSFNAIKAHNKKIEMKTKPLLRIINDYKATKEEKEKAMNQIRELQKNKKGGKL